MPLTRRQAVKAAAAASATTGALAASEPAAAASPAAAPAHQGALADPAFTRLPPGSVRPRGWLAHQLGLQLDGLSGRYYEKSHFLDFANTGWTHPDKDGWEEVTYWLRGYIPLAVVTGDRGALRRVRRWVDAILATQQPDGFFGPEALRTQLEGAPDLWPYLPLLMALRTWEEYDGDARLVPFMLRFTRFMAAQDQGAFDRSWVSYRWGDGLDLAMWLYDRTGEGHLLDLCDTMHEYGADWTAERLPTEHNVNIAQGFREPAQYARRSGDAALTRATYRAYERLLGEYGQFPGGGFAGDENRRPGFADPRQGFETCGIVEFMASHQVLTRITGDPVWADRCEELAFNMLPAALDPQGKAIHYITAANSVDLGNDVKTQGQFQNGFAMLAYHPGVDSYRCCPHNYGMGWPYLAEELWLGTPGGGLAAAMYAPSEVTARVADGTEVTVAQETDYPFGETVTLRLSLPAPAAFPLRLRIPGWCRGPELAVNGEPHRADDGPAFATVRRTWRDGDTVALRLPQRTTVRTWQHNGGAVSVDHGPLTYSLRIEETYERYGGDAAFPEYAVHAASRWNYGLDLDPDHPEEDLQVRRAPGPLSGNPFTHAGTPLRVTAPARRITAWTADSEQVVDPLQAGPARAEGKRERITLIPMGAARLRITAFPRVAADGRPWHQEAPYHRVENKHSGKVLAVDGMGLEAGGRVVQFDDSGTGDHAWQFLPRGQGRYLVRNGYSGKVLGVEDDSGANSARIVQYAADESEGGLLWRLVADENGAAGWHRIANVRTGKVLGVADMSTADSAQIVQYDDNGTPDHLWRLR